MALIKCPECGQQISDKAGVCPNCGHPIAYEKMKVNVSSFFKKKWVKILGVIILIYILLVIISNALDDYNSY